MTETGPRSVKFRPVVWAVLACLFLGVSGLVRARQDRRIEAAARRFAPAPFALKDLPGELPGWRYVEGGDQSLDPQIAKIAGSSDHLIRTYVDDKTGVAVSVLVIYGQGQMLSQHVPEVCYPNVGFNPGVEAADISIPNGRRAPAVFRSLKFVKTGGAVVDREEVYYSFRHEGRWYPDAALDWKRFRDNPGMFKVQVQRRLAEREERSARDPKGPSNHPTDKFLTEFLAVLEQKIAESQRTAESSDAIKSPGSVEVR